MPRHAAVFVALQLAAGACLADNCDAIRAQIDARMRAGGLAGFTLAVVDKGSAQRGRVLGTCANSTRQIVQTVAAGGSAPPAGMSAPTAAATPTATSATPAATPAAATPVRSPVAVVAAPVPPLAAEARPRPADRIPTECKDGSIVLGPDCNDPRAVRMTKAQIDEAAAAAGTAATTAATSTADKKAD